MLKDIMCQPFALSVDLQLFSCTKANFPSEVLYKAELFLLFEPVGFFYFSSKYFWWNRSSSLEYKSLAWGCLSGNF